MSITAWFARNRAATVLYHNPQSELTPSDVEFAATQLDGPTLFVVDNAADYTDALETSIHRLRGLGVDAFVLMGERLNEWRQARPRFRPRETLRPPFRRRN